MPTLSPIAPLPSSARSGSGVGATVDLVQMTTADLTVGVSAIDAGATLTVTLETSPDQVAWRPLEQGFLPISITGVMKGTFPGADRYVRARWAIAGAGTPLATFSVTGNAVLVYATPDDLDVFGVSGARLGSLSNADKDRYLRHASDTANMLLQNHLGLPLLQWGDDLREIVCSIATWMILSKRVGFVPEAGTGKDPIVTNYENAMKLLKMVSDGDAELVGAVDSTPNVPDDGGAFIYSDAPRGWYR